MWGRRKDESDVPTRYHYRTGEPMTTPQRAVHRPPFNQASNNVECAQMSQRDPDVDNAVGCDVCTHTACKPEWPCETCNVVVFLRELRQDVNQLKNRADNGADAIGALSGRVTATESSISTHTTQIGNRPTNGQVNTAITNAVTPVDDKVNTLKTRVDNATGFPIA